MTTSEITIERAVNLAMTLKPDELARLISKLTASLERDLIAAESQQSGMLQPNQASLANSDTAPDNV
ncbi:MAG: hypothetical protein ACRD82_21850 [Blastocatellia bacterium]